jgi:hypothetical protein
MRSSLLVALFTDICFLSRPLSSVSVPSFYYYYYYPLPSRVPVLVALQARLLPTCAHVFFLLIDLMLYRTATGLFNPTPSAFGTAPSLLSSYVIRGNTSRSLVFLTNPRVALRNPNGLLGCSGLPDVVISAIAHLPGRPFSKFAASLIVLLQPLKKDASAVANYCWPFLELSDQLLSRLAFLLFIFYRALNRTSSVYSFVSNERLIS